MHRSSGLRIAQRSLPATSCQPPSRQLFDDEDLQSEHDTSGLHANQHAGTPMLNINNVSGHGHSSSPPMRTTLPCKFIGQLTQVYFRLYRVVVSHVVGCPISHLAMEIQHTLSTWKFKGCRRYYNNSGVTLMLFDQCVRKLPPLIKQTPNSASPMLIEL